MDSSNTVESVSQSGKEELRRKRGWLKWILAAVALVGVIAVGSTCLYFANAYMPLQVTGDGPDMTAGGLFVRSANGEFGDPRTLVYCSTANGRFAVALLIINTGSFPVTILGGDPGPGGPVTDHTNVNGFALLDLADHRSQPGNLMSEATDPRTATPLAPTTLSPGRELDVWARFQMGAQVLYGDSSVFTHNIWIRYSTFGITRTAGLPLGDGIAVTGNCANTTPAARSLQARPGLDQIGPAQA
jgi:hypothetical protein